MKLRKIVLTIVAVLGVTVAFAGNTSDLRIYIQQFFKMINVSVSMMADEEDPETAEITQTIQALKKGLLQYDTELSAGNLLEQSKIIDETFQEIPVILNKIKTSSKEIEGELAPQIEKLTTAVINNQTEVPAEKVNHEIALGLMESFAQGKALAEGTLEDSVSEILQMEALMNMFQMFGEDD